MGHISRDYVDDYIDALSNYTNTDVMKEMIRVAQSGKIPILRPAATNLIHVLVKTLKPKIALEVGTSIGYSSLVIIKAMPDIGKLITIEKDEERIASARRYFGLEGVSHRITVLNGDAGEILNYMEGSVDLIFLDGPKGQYINYLPHCIRLLNPSGMLLCDDVLFHGMIARDDLVRQKQVTIVKRMREFLDAISNHPELDTAIIPVGDGISISYKKE